MSSKNEFSSRPRFIFLAHHGKDSVQQHPFSDMASPPSYSEQPLLAPQLPPSPFTTEVVEAADAATSLARIWQPGNINGEGKFTADNERYVIGTKNPIYSKDEMSLYHLLMQQAAIPPRVGISVKGDHIEPGDCNQRTKPKIDSDLKVNVSGLFVGTQSTHKTWQVVKTPALHIATYRGGCFRSTAESELEADADVEAWCHFYVKRVAQSMLPHVFVMERQPGPSPKGHSKT